MATTTLAYWPQDKSHTISHSSGCLQGNPTAKCVPVEETVPLPGFPAKRNHSRELSRFLFPGISCLARTAEEVKKFTALVSSSHFASSHLHTRKNTPHWLEVHGFIPERSRTYYSLILHESTVQIWCQGQKYQMLGRPGRKPLPDRVSYAGPG